MRIHDQCEEKEGLVASVAQTQYIRHDGVSRASVIVTT